MGRKLDFERDHPEIDWDKLKSDCRKLKKADRPFFDNWQNQNELNCLAYVGAIPRTISLLDDCQGDCELYDAEIEKQLLGFSVASCVVASINNTTQRKKTLRGHLKRIFDAFPSGVLFGTYTFKPEKLPKTAEEEDEMDKVVRSVLYSYSDTFIVNRDYRPKTGALHYHFFIVADNIDYQDWDLKYGYGFSFFEHARYNSNRTTSYLFKIESHPLKASTKGSHLFYSKGVRDLARKERQES